jgi:7-cyano-7-deazaguanine reductase
MRISRIFQCLTCRRGAESLEYSREISYIVHSFLRNIVEFMKKKKQGFIGKPLKGLDRRYDIETIESIDVDVLETFPYEYSGKESTVNIETEEFTAVCPYSGLPDFGTIKVQYIPKNDIIELRSFKYYLFSYRNVGIYQEHLVNRILEDLVRVSKPKWMEVVADYNIRGGVHTVARVEWGKR